MSTTASGPLAGLRIVDLTSVIMGPLATQILGDMGADVIVIEPNAGTVARVMSPGPVSGLSGIALNLLRNKQMCPSISRSIGHVRSFCSLWSGRTYSSRISVRRL